MAFGVISSFVVSFIPNPCKTEKTADKVQLALPFSIRDSVFIPTPHSAAQSASFIFNFVLFALISLPSTTASSMCAELGMSETLTRLAILIMPNNSPLLVIILLEVT